MQARPKTGMLPNSEHIVNELINTCPAVARIGRANVYSVPLHYFDGLAGDILCNVYRNVAGQPAAGGPFTIPQGYFDNLPAQILQLCKQHVETPADELTDTAPLLTTISRKMPFAVPQGYFDTTLQPAPHTQTAPVVSMLQGFKRYTRYAVAAAVMGIVAISAWLLSPGLSNQQAAGTYPTAKINVNAALQKASDDDIIEYLNQHSTGADISAVSLPGDVEIDVQTLIQYASDEEIKAFLKESEQPAQKQARES